MINFEPWEYFQNEQELHCIKFKTIIPDNMWVIWEYDNERLRNTTYLNLYKLFVEGV